MSLQGFKSFDCKKCKRFGVSPDGKCPNCKPKDKRVNVLVIYDKI